MSLIHTSSHARVKGTTRIYYPNPAVTARYEPLFGIYRSLAPVLHPANHALAEWRSGGAVGLSDCGGL